jgi:xylan 1,4-beta-xylosidase
MYSSYTAAQIARTYELADLHRVNLLGSVTWAFEFEDQPYFAGFRDLASNGIDKPVLNVFRMLGKMTGDRLRVESSGAAPIDAIRDQGVRGAPDVNALASGGSRGISVLVWNYHDDDVVAPPADVELTLDRASNGRPMLTHYRVDADHSNSYEVWKRMGAPQPPSREQYERLARTGRLQTLRSPQRVRVENGQLRLNFSLPRQGVSLLKIDY